MLIKNLIIKLILILSLINLILTTRQEVRGLATYLGKSSPINFNIQNFDTQYEIPIIKSLSNDKILALNFDLNMVLGEDAESFIRVGYVLVLLRNGELPGNLNFDNFDPNSGLEHRDFYSPNRRVIYSQFRTLTFNSFYSKDKTSKLVYPMPIEMNPGDQIIVLVKAKKALNNFKFNKKSKIKIKETIKIKRKEQELKNNKRFQLNKLLNSKRFNKINMNNFKNDIKTSLNKNEQNEKFANFAYLTGFVTFISENSRKQYINNDLEKIY